MDIRDELTEKIKHEMDGYAQQIQSMTVSQLCAHAGEISATMFCFHQLTETSDAYPLDYMEYLLRFEHPLSVVRDRWLSEQGDAPSEAFEHTLWELWDKQDAEVDYAMDSGWHDGPSMC